MKISAVLCVFLLVVGLTGCTFDQNVRVIHPETLNGSGKIVEVNRVVNEFDQVEFGALGELTITRGSENSLLIKADDNLIDKITTKVENRTLKIAMQPNLSFNPTEKIEYHLVVKELSGITLSGFGDISADVLDAESLNVQLLGSGDIKIGQVTGKSLSLSLGGFGSINIEKMTVDTPDMELRGSGDINIHSLEAQQLNLRMSGFGSTTINGKTTRQEVELSGSGDYHADNLQSETATIQLSGFGSGKLWVDEKLDVVITGSGSVDYYGNPELTQRVTGFGEVNSLGAH